MVFSCEETQTMSLSNGDFAEWRADPVKTKDTGMVGVGGWAAKLHKRKGWMVQDWSVLGELGMAKCWAPSLLLR